MDTYYSLLVTLLETINVKRYSILITVNLRKFNNGFRSFKLQYKQYYTVEEKHQLFFHLTQHCIIICTPHHIFGNEMLLNYHLPGKGQDLSDVDEILL